MKKTNRFLSILLAVLMVPMLVVCSPVFAVSESNYLYDSEVIPEGGMLTIAHRGYSAAAPENTLPAFRLAGENGFWGAECDVWRTADGQWVLMHDATVDRMTDGSGEVSMMSADELRALTINAGSNVSQYPNTRIPTLEEYLDVCKQYGLHAVIEIKSGVREEYLPSLAAILNAREEKAQFIIISFARALAAGMKKLMPATPVYLLTGLTAIDDVDFCVENGIDGIDFSYQGIPRDVLCAAQDAGLETLVWTVDSFSVAEEFYSLGVKAITTNCLLPGKSPETEPASSPTEESSGEKPAENLNIFQRIIQWFKDLFAKLFCRKG